MPKFLLRDVYHRLEGVRADALPFERLLQLLLLFFKLSDALLERLFP